VRAVLDPNILISALLSPDGAPAQIISRWLGGEFELVVSADLLAELERALGYPKLRARVTQAEAEELIDLLRQAAVVGVDPSDPPSRSPDPGDDYLLALAEGQSATLVSGDAHVLGLADRFPIFTPAAFLDRLPEGAAE
jgi:putative PIN family toxin of toxin-antitoxin system